MPAAFCILSWRVPWLTMLNRIASDASLKLALTETEITLLRDPSTMSPWNPCTLSYQTCTGWRPGQSGRSTARKGYHLARPLETNRYQTRPRNRSCWKCG